MLPVHLEVFIKLKLPMKTLALLSMLCFVAVVDSFAQSEKEKEAITAEVKKLDLEHAQAVLTGDLKTMDKYWTLTLL